jgi:hypothetical protein
MTIVVRRYSRQGSHRPETPCVALPGPWYAVRQRECSCLMHWIAAAFRYLLMSRTEKYLDHAIDRSDFERRLRVVRRRM